MVDPFDVLKCVYAVVTFAYKRGPTHRLDKTDKHLSNVLDVIEDHRDYKPDQEVKDLLEEYDSLRVLVQDTREEYTSRPVLLKITPKVMSDVRNLKKKSKVLLTSAKRSSDAAKRRALLQPTTVTGQYQFVFISNSDLTVYGEMQVM
ncbi:hypothetical protein CERSUDRAFT_92872 [Gelatoporia subvermispora B]|uniref:Uncharacterized protein n=1 Tax=Ceriporiopsis subvermispora (strain B) TaxID=914234 RepID=M2QP46_CERS8|nr:hypothetical protein CERSUDRAFT_92872 [Gelatoporia subvermispora B]